MFAESLLCGSFCTRCLMSTVSSFPESETDSWSSPLGPYMLLVNVRTSVQIQAHLVWKSETSCFILLIFIASPVHENNAIYPPLAHKHTQNIVTRFTKINSVRFMELLKD